MPFNIAQVINALKKLGVQNADQMSPDQLQKTMKAMGKEMSDQPDNLVGSGKNLEVLQNARQSAPDMNDLGKAPSYPKNIQQDDLSIKRAAPTDPGFTMPDSNAGTLTVTDGVLPKIPAAKSPSEEILEELGPQVPDADIITNRATKAASPMMGDIPEGSLGSADDLFKPEAMGLGKKASIAAGLGGVGLLGLNMLGEDQPAQAAAQPPMQVQPNLEVQPKVSAQQAMPVKQTGSKAEPTKEGKQVSAEAANTQSEPQPMNYMQQLIAAQDGQNSQDLVNNMLRAGTTIGAALGRTQADYSGVDALAKQSGQGVAQVKDRMSTEKAENELNDEKKLKDPSSDVSKAFRQALAKLGIQHSDKTTANDAKAMGINIQNLLMQEKTIAAAQAKADRDAGKRTNSFVTGAQKLLLKPYQQFQKVDTAYNNLSKFLKDGKGSGPKDIATLYDFVKILDPDSAVKEGEISLSKEGMSLFEKYGVQLRKIGSGEILSPEFRSAVLDIIKQKRDAAEAQYDQIRQPVLLQAADYGLETEDFGKLDYHSAAQSKAGKQAAGQFPRQVRKGNQVATVSNEQEFKEAQAEGFN